MNEHKCQYESEGRQCPNKAKYAIAVKITLSLPEGFDPSSIEPQVQPGYVYIAYYTCGKHVNKLCRDNLLKKSMDTCLTITVEKIQDYGKKWNEYLDV